MKRSFFLVALVSLTGARSIPVEEPAQSSNRTAIVPDHPSDRAIIALNQATVALGEWRREAEGGALIDDASYQRLMASLRELWEELEGLSSRVAAQEARNPPAPVAERAPVQERAYDVPRASKIAEIWVEDMRALGDGATERRQRALADMQAALQGPDRTFSLAALKTLQQIGDVAFDKERFRSLVLPFVGEASGEELVAALYALHATSQKDEDLALLHEAWTRRSLELDRSMAHLLFLFGGGAIESRSEQIALELFATTDPSELRLFLGGLWGARVGPSLEARVLELAAAKDGDLAHNALYFGLSTFKDKSPAVIEALISFLPDPDHNNSGRALWGLSHGVPEASQARVAEALVELHNARSDPETRSSCARLVELYGGPNMSAMLAK